MTFLEQQQERSLPASVQHPVVSPGDPLVAMATWFPNEGSTYMKALLWVERKVKIFIFIVFLSFFTAMTQSLKYKLNYMSRKAAFMFFFSSCRTSDARLRFLKRFKSSPPHIASPSLSANKKIKQWSIGSGSLACKPGEIWEDAFAKYTERKKRVTGEVGQDWNRRVCVCPPQWQKREAGPVFLIASYSNWF